MMATRRNDIEDDAGDTTAVVPEPDYVDARPGRAPGATAWGDPGRRDLAPVEEVLDGVLGRLAQPERTTLQAVLDSWEAAAGPAWERAKPVLVDRDVLVVEVADGLTASRLQFDVTRLLAALQTAVGPAVGSVRFRVPRR